MYNPEFTAYGYFQAKPKLRLPNVKIEIEGKYNIEFKKTGWKYVLTQPNMRIKGVITGSRKFVVEGDGFIYGAGNPAGKYIPSTAKLGENVKNRNLGSERYFSKMGFGGEKKGLFRRTVHARDHVDGAIWRLKTPELATALDEYFFGDKSKVNFDKVISKASKKGRDLDLTNAIGIIDGHWTGDMTIGNL
jgi:hypothetical protein